MKEFNINQNTADLALEKGFDSRSIIDRLFNIGSNICSQSFLQRWLRSKDIYVEVLLDRTTAPKFAVEIYQYSHFGNYKKVVQKEWYLYRSYEEALEVGLVEGLKLL